MSKPILSIDNVSHWFGSNRVLHKLNFEILAGQIVALVGPSGCGKSTLLRTIVGTHLPKAGQVCITQNGSTRVVQHPDRDCGIVYQRYSLFPHLTAQENVAYGLMLGRYNFLTRLIHRKQWKKLRNEHMDQAADMLEKMKLGNALKKYPPEMSGGMCQRVAIAQALIMKPGLLLLDEPFGALDEATREELQRILLKLYEENLKAIADKKTPPHTIIIVTHEINEAIFVSNRIIGLSQYWDWKAADEKKRPGATIVYDKSTPVFAPEDPRDFLSFQEQKKEILSVVFDPEHLQSHNEYVQLSHQVQNRSRDSKIV